MPKPPPPPRKARQDAPAQNRSLERGLEILLAFRPGTDLMGNGEIAERTGIAKATVSRLTQTLVRAGMLDYDGQARAYRIGAAALSLALAMRQSNPALQAALKLMRTASERLHVNVGLATAHGQDMVYLESFRYNRRPELRTVVSGQRIPIELTSLGRAYLAAAPAVQRSEFLDALRARNPGRFEAVRRPIAEAIAQVREHGFCAVAWQRDVVAVATPVVLPYGPIYALNMSISGRESLAEIVETLPGPLLALRGEIMSRLGCGTDA